MVEITVMHQLPLLGLGQARITDACLPAVKTLPKLESLQIVQTEATDAALVELTFIPTLRGLSPRPRARTPGGPAPSPTSASPAW